MTAEPITIERLECALDRLAEIMVTMGDDGRHYLPIYDRIESELESMRANEDRMSAVRKRLERSKGQRAA